MKSLVAVLALTTALTFPELMLPVQSRWPRLSMTMATISLARLAEPFERGGAQGRTPASVLAIARAVASS